MSTDLLKQEDFEKSKKKIVSNHMKIEAGVDSIKSPDSFESDPENTFIEKGNMLKSA